MNSTRNAIVYCRISDDATSERAGVERQRKDCEKFCAEQGWFVVDVIVDNDFSASRYAKRKRPGYTRALSMLRTGQANTLVAWNIDRLYRQPRELEDLIDLAEEGDVLVSTMHGDMNLETGDGRAFARILVTMAAKESDNTSRRVRRVREDEARRGQAHGGTRTFGYTKGTKKIVPEEARLLRAAAKRVLAGASISTIAREWNTKGVPTVRGGQWHPTTMRQMLVNPKYAGLRATKGEIVAEGTWKPIFSREIHERLTRTVHNSRRKVGVPQNVALLTNLVRCGVCGQPLSRDDGKLRCKANVGRKNCGKIVIVQDKTEAEVTARVLDALDGPGFRGAHNDDGDDRTFAADIVVDLERELNELAADFGAGTITRGEWLAARKGVETRLDDARGLLTHADHRVVLEGLTDVRRHWGRFSMEKRRNILAAVVDHVVINPATRLGRFYDPGRVVVVWRS